MINDEIGDFIIKDLLRIEEEKSKRELIRAKIVLFSLLAGLVVGCVVRLVV